MSYQTRMTIKLFSKVIQPTILFLSAAISSSVYDCLMKKYWMESTKSWRNKKKRSLFLLLCNTNNVVLLQIRFYCKKKHPQMRLKDRFFLKILFNLFSNLFSILETLILTL